MTSMESTNSRITCPRCQTEFEITEVMRSQVAAQIRGELERDAADRRAALEAEKRQLKQDRETVEAERMAIAEQVRAQVEAQREQLLTNAKKKAEEDLAVEIRDRDEQLVEIRRQLKTAQDNEVELRKRERKLQSKTEELELEVTRQVDAECEKIRTEARQQFQQQHQLKDAEKDSLISGLRREIDELKRKAEQGSQQLQGEVQELALEELLRTAFPADNIEGVAQGVSGGDTLQRVLDPTGLSCGSILWESKRTKNWSHTWLAKLRDDQRAARAACAVIVSETLPDGVHTFEPVGGVWVCSWSCVTALAAALRVGLIEVAKSRLAVQGQHEKMEMVYNYLASQEFRHRVGGIVEAFVTMQHDLESEKRSMKRLWSKREKQIERALTNTAGMYGDLQGIIGASLPAIDGLSLLRIESKEVALDSAAVEEAEVATSAEV